MKHLANTLTILRLVLSVPVAIIFIIYGFNTVGMILFIIACVTDMIDGTIARAANNGEGTKFGKIIDTVADMSLVVVAALFIVPAMELSAVLYWLCIAGFAYKVLSSLVGYIKHKKVNMLLIHTYLMKSLGYILFIWVVVHWIFSNPDATPTAITNGYTIFVIVSIFVLTTEELLISLLLKGPSSDIRTIFRIKQENLKYEVKDKD
jgi:cardiolipin synthase